MTTRKIIGGNLTLVENMPWIISIWSAIYLTSLGVYLKTSPTTVVSPFVSAAEQTSGLKETKGMLKYTVFSFILVILPHCNSTRYQFACYLVTAVIAFVAINEIQQTINYPLGLISFIITIMAYRIVLTNSFIDNFCICWAFSVAACAFLGKSSHNDLIVLQGMLFVWSFFAYSYMFTTIHGRVSNRSWENIQTLLLLLQKTRYESASSLALVEKQLPKEVVDYIRRSSDSNEPVFTFKSEDDDMVRAAKAENIIPNDSSFFCLTEKMLTFEGLEMRKTAVVIIRRQIPDDQRDSALANLSEENFRSLLTMLGRRKKMTFLRQFGGAWIGCVGFFESWGSEEQDCRSALQFAGEVSLLEKSLLGKLSIAVEFGNLTGGFLGSLDFDLFGQEIRWLLMVVELKLSGKVVIGDSLRKKVLCQSGSENNTGGGGGVESPSSDTGLNPLMHNLNKESFRLPWKIDSTIVLTYLLASENCLGKSDFHNCVSDFMVHHGLQRKSIFYSDVMYDLDIRTMAADFSETTAPPSDGKINSAAKNVAERRLELAYPQYSGLYRRLEAKGSERLDEVIRQVCSQDIGIEFFTSVEERFGLDLSELTCSEQTILEKMTTVRTFIDRFCFPTRLRYVFLNSIYQPNCNLDASLQNKAVRAKKSSERFLFASPCESMVLLQVSRHLRFLWKKTTGLLCRSSKWRWRHIMAFFDFRHSINLNAAFLQDSPHSFQEFVHEIDTCNSPLYRRQTARLYCDEAKLLVQNRVINALVYGLTHAVSILGVIGVVRTLAAANFTEATLVGITFTSKSATIFLVLIIVHLVLVIVLEGRYNYLMSIISIIAQLVFIGLASILANTPHNNARFQIATWNTVGLHLVSFFSTLLYFRSVYIPMVVDSTIFGLLSWRAFLFGKQYQFALQKNLSSITFPFLHYMIWGLEHNTFVCFILEHVLIPAANDNYNRQKKSTTAIKAALVPHCDLDDTRSRSNVVIVAIHIKAADIISGFLDPRDLFVLLRKLQCLVDECIIRCDFVKMVQFSGITLAFISDDANPAVSRASPSIEAQCKVIALLKVIQDSMDAFNNENNFRIPFGIAINYGLANISPFANRLDLHGITRDMALAMSCFNHEGVFISNLFSSELFQSAGMRSSVYVHACIPKSLGYVWLQIDGDLSQLQLLNSFEYICRLGRGGFGSVHLLREKDSGVLYAIKMVILKEGAAMSTLIKRECTILQMMQHPNVVSLKSSFLWKSRLYLVMSYVRGGNLRQVIVRDKVGLPHLQFWFAELVLAIEYVHSMGIIHRDIKPENCMIGTDGHLQLVDFGLAKIIYVKKTAPDTGGDGVPSKEHPPQLISREARYKITQFFPSPLGLNTDTTVTVVLVTTDSASEICARLQGIALNVLVASSQSEVKTILREGKIRISAIFLDINDKLNLFSKSHFWWFSDGMLTFHVMSRPKQRFEQFYSNTAVYVIADCNEKARYKLKSAGVRECFSKHPVDYAAIVLALRRDVGILQTVKDSAGANTDRSAGDSSSQSLEAVSSNSVASTMSIIDHSDKGGDSVEDIQDHVHSAVGTLHFLAPEVIRHQKYGKPVDWWACGVTFYECLAKGHLFQGKHRQDVIDDILNGPIDLSKILEFGEPITDLIRGLVNRDVVQRLGSRGAAMDIKGHVFFSGCDWLTLSKSNTMFKPAQFVNKHFHLQDKLQFYDATASAQSMMNQRNVATMERFQTNRRRLREARKGIHLRSIARYALSGAVQEKRRLLVRGQHQQGGNDNRERRILLEKWTITNVEEKDDDDDEDDFVGR